MVGDAFEDAPVVASVSLHSTTTATSPSRIAELLPKSPSPIGRRLVAIGWFGRRAGTQCNVSKSPPRASRVREHCSGTTPAALPTSTPTPRSGCVAATPRAGPTGSSVGGERAAGLDEDVVPVLIAARNPSGRAPSRRDGYRKPRHGRSTSATRCPSTIGSARWTLSAETPRTPPRPSSSRSTPRWTHSSDTTPYLNDRAQSVECRRSSSAISRAPHERRSTSGCTPGRRPDPRRTRRRRRPERG
jgi:hypothetical protein